MLSSMSSYHFLVTWKTAQQSTYRRSESLLLGDVMVMVHVETSSLRLTSADPASSVIERQEMIKLFFGNFVFIPKICITLSHYVLSQEKDISLRRLACVEVR